jgi:hypothetical protein
VSARGAHTLGQSASQSRQTTFVCGFGCPQKALHHIPPKLVTVCEQLLQGALIAAAEVATLPAFEQFDELFVLGSHVEFGRNLGSLWGWFFLHFFKKIKSLAGRNTLFF